MKEFETKLVELVNCYSYCDCQMVDSSFKAHFREALLGLLANHSTFSSVKVVIEVL